MLNPIPRAGLWVTPVSAEDLQARVEACTSKWDAMMLTMNYCRKLVALRIAEEEQDKAERAEAE
jgi:hypothetical protein